MKMPKSNLTQRISDTLNALNKKQKDIENERIDAEQDELESQHFESSKPLNNDEDDGNRTNIQPKPKAAIAESENNENVSLTDSIAEAGNSIAENPIEDEDSIEVETASKQEVSEEDTKQNDNEALALEEDNKASSVGSMLANLFDRATRARKSMGTEQVDHSQLNDKNIDNNKHTGKDDSTQIPTAQNLRLAFLGGGSFGTAMSNLAARNGCDSTLWVRNKRTVRYLNKHRVNKKYLPDYVLDERLKFEHDLASAVKDKDIIFVAVPSSAFRETLKKIAPYITGQSIVSLTKGMEKDTFALMSDIITDELPEVNYGVMSGPNLAVEIMQNMPSASVIASDSEPLRLAVQSALHSAFFRVFAADDVRGVELGGALKNIYAIAMGMAAAYDVGENTKAMLLTRALAEMSRFGAASGANPLTFLGLSGVGDLYATCSSELSRNYRIGSMLGKGISLESAIKKLGQTAEGVNTIQQVHEKATQEGIYMPITHALYAVIYNDQAALGVALNLMEAGFRSDVEFVMPHGRSNDELSAQMDRHKDTVESNDSQNDD